MRSQKYIVRLRGCRCNNKFYFYCTWQYYNVIYLSHTHNNSICRRHCNKCIPSLFIFILMMFITCIQCVNFRVIYYLRYLSYNAKMSQKQRYNIGYSYYYRKWKASTHISLMSMPDSMPIERLISCTPFTISFDEAFVITSIRPMTLMPSWRESYSISQLRKSYEHNIDAATDIISVSTGINYAYICYSTSQHTSQYTKANIYDN